MGVLPVGHQHRGAVVEVVSGKSFSEFLRDADLRPARDEGHDVLPHPEQLARLAKSYARNKDGALEEPPSLPAGQDPHEPRPLPSGQRRPVLDRRRLLAASAGCSSTAASSRARRLLKPESVRQMTTVQSGDIKTGFTPGNGWGLGVCVVREPQGVTAMLSPGTFGHGGAFGTQAWVDPKIRRIYILMVQRANFPNSDASPVRLAFQKAAARVLDGK